jgi:hypothetical protein
MLSYLPGGDEMPDLAPPCVHDEIVDSVHLTERLNPLLAIIVSGIDRFDDLWVLEDQGGFKKIDLPPLPFVSTLLLIP